MEPEPGTGILTIDRVQVSRVLLNADWYLSRVGHAVGDEVDRRARDGIAILVDLIDITSIDANCECMLV